MNRWLLSLVSLLFATSCMHSSVRSRPFFSEIDPEFVAGCRAMCVEFDESGLCVNFYDRAPEICEDTFGAFASPADHRVWLASAGDDFDLSSFGHQSGGSVLLQYPWPPHLPSTSASLTAHFRDAGRPLTFDQVGRKLTRALSFAGYDDYGFYRVPGGFALVTRLEATSADGAALAGRARYKVPVSKDGLAAAVRAMREETPEGYYRFIVFVVTNIKYRFASEPLSVGETGVLLDNRATGLDDELGGMHVSPNHEIDALIYEFEIDAQRSVTLIRPSRLSGSAHLEATGIIYRIRFDDFAN